MFLIPTTSAPSEWMLTTLASWTLLCYNHHPLSEILIVKILLLTIFLVPTTCAPSKWMCSTLASWQAGPPPPPGAPMFSALTHHLAYFPQFYIGKVVQKKARKKIQTFFTLISSFYHWILMKRMSMFSALTHHFAYLLSMSSVCCHVAMLQILPKHTA